LRASFYVRAIEFVRTLRFPVFPATSHQNSLQKSRAFHSDGISINLSRTGRPPRHALQQRSYLAARRDHRHFLASTYVVRSYPNRVMLIDCSRTSQEDNTAGRRHLAVL
jgi:hypothetical protein